MMFLINLSGILFFIYFWYFFQSSKNGGFSRHPWAYFGQTARENFSFTSVSHGDGEGLYDWPQGTP